MTILQVSSRAGLCIGFDYNLRNLRTAMNLQKERGVTNASFFSASAEAQLPFPDDCFDKVLILDVIEHLYERTQILGEIKRVLVKNGLVLLSAPNRDNSWKRTLRSAGLPYYADADHKIEYTLPELESELHGAGLRVAITPQPVVLETPLAGIIDLIGGLSLSMYARLQQWKRESAQNKPNESTGWRIVCVKAVQ
jgi:SAM-dependent methyltransferase